METNLSSFKVKAANGQDVDLSTYKNQVVLIVNVASKCGYTPQYAGLEKLYQEFKGQGLVILGFPCNQFGAQEPGSDQEIQQFCSLNYGVSFPVLGKVEVNGKDTAPVYEWLKKSAPGLLGTEAIKWNFTKFLIGRDGQVIDRFAPATAPDALAKDIRQALS